MWNLRVRPRSSPGVLGVGNQDLPGPPAAPTGYSDHPIGLLCPQGWGGCLSRPLCLLPPHAHSHFPLLPLLPEACSVPLPRLPGSGPYETLSKGNQDGPSHPHIISPSERSDHRGKGTGSPTVSTQFSQPRNSTPSAHWSWLLKCLQGEGAAKGAGRENHSQNLGARRPYQSFGTITAVLWGHSSF